ncbi:unnamed protein product, partial [Symbiodinium sp. CCMP2592]
MDSRPATPQNCDGVRLERTCQEEALAKKDTEAAAALLLKLTQALGGDAVHRSNATKKLADTVEVNTTFLLDLSRHTPQALEALLLLQGNAMLQLGGVGYKRETLRRSPVAKKIK